MDVKQIVEKLDSQFVTKNNSNYFSEVELTYNAHKDVSKIGYATNLTIEVIEKAKNLDVDMIVTHHDAWDFIGDLKAQCMSLLEKYGISHYYNHLPLDDADFGTNASLAKALGLKTVKRVNKEDGYMCGLIGEYDQPLDFKDFVKRISDVCEEKVQFWQYHQKSIKRVHILCGAGFSTNFMETSLEDNCDVYLTGEKILYTIQFAKLKALNLVVGSHTFTELLGVKGMLEKLQVEDVEIVKIQESHIEEDGFTFKHN